MAKAESAISGPDGKGTFGRLRAWLNSSRSRSSDSALERVSMDSENYYWWLIRLGHSDYAVQYTGPDPAVHFPLSLADNDFLEIVMSFYRPVRQNIEPAFRSRLGRGFSALLGGLERGPRRTTAQQEGERNVQVKRDYSSTESNAESIPSVTSDLHRDEMLGGEPTEHGNESVTGSHGGLDDALSFIDPIDTSSDLVPSPTETRFGSLRARSSEDRTLVGLLTRYALARYIISYLDFKATMSLQQLLPSLTDVCRNHVLHHILSETHIIMSTETTGGHERETNRDMLYPVIARIPPEERVFPDNRIVFESKHYSRTCGGFRAGDFVTTCLGFYLPGHGQNFTWELEQESPMFDTLRRSGLSPRRLLQGDYRFADSISQPPKDGRFPIKVFYKLLEELGSYRLHTLIIPIDFLMDRLNSEFENRFPRRGLREGITALGTGREMQGSGRVYSGVRALNELARG